MTAQQTFLVVEAGLVALLVVAAALLWRRPQPSHAAAVGRLDEVELAAINGGPQLAVITAVTALRRSHVTQTPEGTLVANGPLVDDAGELERELFENVRRAPATPAAALVPTAVESDTVRRLVARLEAAGLRLRPEMRRKLLALRLCSWAVALAAVPGLLAFGTTGEVGFYVVVALVVVALCVARWCNSRQAGPTAAGRRLLKGVRAERKAELRAAGGHLPLAVAMFGTVALWTTDPALAGALAIPAHTQTAFSAQGFAAGWSAGCSGCGGCGGCG
jgi:uncharacterized protein (TIGR04222 family)